MGRRIAQMFHDIPKSAEPGTGGDFTWWNRQAANFSVQTIALLKKKVIA